MKLSLYKSFQYKKSNSIYSSVETQLTWVSFGDAGRAESTWVGRAGNSELGSDVCWANLWLEARWVQRELCLNRAVTNPSGS